jgi:ssDNA-binding Zn-finger/Zn-ribbon topoisomerase 1
MIELDDYPRVSCPKCGEVSIDMDGFGFIACERCGYCKHVAMHEDDGRWHCDICDAVVKL